MKSCTIGLDCGEAVIYTLIFYCSTAADGLVEESVLQLKQRSNIFDFRIVIANSQWLGGDTVKEK